MNLSDKIINLEQIEKDQEFFIKAFGYKENAFVIFTNDVKEAVRLLKEDCNKNDGYTDIDLINKIFGDKLI